MWFFISILLHMALSAVAYANGGKGTPFDSDTFIYHGYSTAEVWIGRSAINIGDMIGDHMFEQMMRGIAEDCPTDRNYCDFKGVAREVQTHYVKDLAKGEIDWTYFSFIAEGKWESEDHRLLLINAVARTMQSLTETTFSENCYNVPNHGKFCNMGDFVRVNLPASPGKQNHMWVKLFGNRVTGEFRCCPTRYKVDAALDEIGDAFVEVYKKPFSRTVWCLIDHQKTCGECGEKCDACGHECPNVCPGGKC